MKRDPLARRDSDFRLSAGFLRSWRSRRIGLRRIVGRGGWRRVVVGVAWVHLAGWLVLRAQDPEPDGSPAAAGDVGTTAAAEAAGASTPEVSGVDPDGAEAPSPENIDSPALSAIRSVLLSIDLAREEIATKERELAAASDPDTRERVLGELRALNAQLSELELDLQQVSTGIDPAQFTQEEGQPFELTRELNDLVAPIVAELKDVTERPREIDRLRKELGSLEKRRALAESALRNVRRLLADAQGGVVAATLQEAEKEWENRLLQIQSRAEVAQFQLDEALAMHRSILDEGTEAVSRFFRSRGRHLLLAALAFSVVYLLLRWLHRGIQRVSPWHRRSERRFVVRLFDVLYHAFTSLGAVAAALLVLYVANDWVLLGLAMILLAGALVLAKTGLPRFYDQAKMLLNFGDVREGERVIYRGVPWLVESVNFYTTLRNPLLLGGEVRLPLNQLPGMNSRPFSREEIWFPSREGDWVILADGTRGKVIRQTPESVQLVLLGGSRKTYPADEFLKLSPENISAGFRLKSVFGIDYRHQPIATGTVPEILQEAVLRRLLEVIDHDEIASVKVEFRQAGASSLDYEIIADIAGACAPRYEVLARALQRAAVDACNANGWTIPFTQITVHQAG